MLLRDEYPRPQFKRENWQILNGIWSFDFDDNNLGIVKKYYEGNNMLSNNFVSAGLKYNSYTDPVAAPIFRKSFVANSSDTAKLTIGATGFYDLFLNGEKITDGFLAPYISNPDEIIFYDEYELSGRLADGENVIAVMLGNGFANHFQTPSLKRISHIDCLPLQNSR